MTSQLNSRPHWIIFALVGLITAISFVSSSWAATEETKDFIRGQIWSQHKETVRAIYPENESRDLIVTNSRHYEWSYIVETVEGHSYQMKLGVLWRTGYMWLISMDQGEPTPRDASGFTTEDGNEFLAEGRMKDYIRTRFYQETGKAVKQVYYRAQAPLPNAPRYTVMNYMVITLDGGVYTLRLRISPGSGYEDYPVLTLEPVQPPRDALPASSCKALFGF
jgi:hypothetical protein